MDERRRGGGSDLSGDALKVAEMNREKLGISKERCTFFKSDLFEKIEGDYDLIVSNPPYIRTEEIEKLQEEVRLYDPYEALDGKEDGLYFYRRMISGPNCIYEREEAFSLRSGTIRQKRYQGFLRRQVLSRSG